MNLCDFYSKPEELDGFADIHEYVPVFIWEKYNKNPKELKKRAHRLSKSSEYAFKYAKRILHGRFLAGEPAMAKDEFINMTYKNFLKTLT